MEFDYAHNDTSAGERQTPTAQFTQLHLPEAVSALRKSAFARGIPTADDETLNTLLCLASAVSPKSILELGTATGISGICLLQTCPSAHLTTVERNEEFFQEAQTNFASFGYTDRVSSILGDAGEVIDTLEGEFDFIFLDSAKVQYVKYLPRLKRLLKKGGMLVADDVLLYGYVTGEVPTPPKRKMLVQHIKEYITAATTDTDLITTVLNVGDGLCVSVKR